MIDSQAVEVLDPAVKFDPASDKELQVVEPNPVFVELVGLTSWTAQ